MYAASCEFYRSFSGMPKTASDILRACRKAVDTSQGKGEGEHTRRVRTCSYHWCVFRTLYHNIAVPGDRHRMRLSWSLSTPPEITLLVCVSPCLRRSLQCLCITHTQLAEHPLLIIPRPVSSTSPAGYPVSPMALGPALLCFVRTSVTHQL